MKMKMKVIAIAAAVAALGLAVTPVTSADNGAKSRIVIKSLTHNGAKGKVISHRGSCEGGKKVSLFRLDDFVSTKIEITKSKSDGRWKTRKDLQPGKYFAKVDSSSGCRYAVSRYKTLH